MTIQGSKNFEIIVDGMRKGSPTKWSHKTLNVDSGWDSGSEQEKFEVLAAIRKLYNPEERANIRGVEGQTAGQVGRMEGFSALQYRRVKNAEVHTIIVPALAGYSRLAKVAG